MVAIREFMKVKDHKLEITLPKDFHYEDVEVVILPTQERDWDYWSDDEIKEFGKHTIGLASNDFDDEHEDYSKW